MEYSGLKVLIKHKKDYPEPPKIFEIKVPKLPNFFVTIFKVKIFKIMAKNRVPKITPIPRPEFVRENTTTPSSTGEVPKRSPNPVPEFTRDGTTMPSIASTLGNVPNVNPNPKPEFLLDGITPPVPLADENDID